MLPACSEGAPRRALGEQRIEEELFRTAAPKRARNAQSTEKSTPASVNSKPRTFFHAMRARTASAACRSASPSANCITVTRARGHGVSAGRPRTANRGANRASS